MSRLAVRIRSLKFSYPATLYSLQPAYNNHDWAVSMKAGVDDLIHLFPSDEHGKIDGVGTIAPVEYTNERAAFAALEYEIVK